MLCKSCLQEKQPDAFSKNNAFPSGKEPTCRDCRKKKRREKKIAAGLPVREYTITELPSGERIKRCATCKGHKPIKDFSPSTTHSTGVQAYCKTCYAQYARDRKREQFAKDGKTLREMHIRPRYKLPDGQLGMECNQCGISKALEDFCKSHNKSGHTQPCRACANMQKRERYATDHEYRKRLLVYYQQWQRANPEKSRLHGVRRRAKKKGKPKTFTQEERVFMLQYWGYACAVCGRQEGLFGWKLQDDHWVALAFLDCPGTVAHNMVPLCGGKDSCNTTKNARNPHDWLVDRFGKRKAATIEKRIHTYFEVVKQRKQQEAS